MSTIEKLKAVDPSEADQEELVDLLDGIEVELSSYSEPVLRELADALVGIIKVRRGIVGRKAEEILTKIYPRVKEQIVSLLWSDDAFVRNTALKIIAVHKDREVLYELIKDTDKDIRKFALDIAFEIGDSEFIKKGLDDTDVNVVVSAAEYLARLGDDSAVDKVVEIFRKTPKEDIYSLLFLLESLVKLRYPKTAELIKEKFDDIDDPMIKPIYVKACGFTGEKKYLDELLSSLSDEDVRKEAIEGLIYFVRNTSIGDDDKKKIKEKIEEHLMHMSPSEMEESKKILDMLGV